MQVQDFDIIAKEQFHFLESEFNFRLSKSENEEWGYQLLYLNDSTGVKITYEYREAYIFIMLYKLKDGCLVENPRNIEENTSLNGFALDDVIILRNPEDIIKPTYEYDEDSEFFQEDDGLSRYTAAFAEYLKKHGADMLDGDFNLFPELDKVVKSRAMKYKQL